MHIEEQGTFIRHIIHAVRLLLNKHKFKPPVDLTICCNIIKALVIHNWNHDVLLESLLRVKIIYAGEIAPILSNAVCTTVDGCELILSPVDIDTEEELKRYKKEQEKCYKFLCAKQSKLNNTGFKQKAPIELIQKEEIACIELERQLQLLKTKILELENHEQ
jgi:valyl-tRNA synthetase